MMKDDKEKWIDEVLGSLAGSQRAKPSPDLLARIESRLDTPETKPISTRQWTFAVAAAVLVLVLNVFALRHFSQNTSAVNELVVSEDARQSLISNFKIYE